MYACIYIYIWTYLDPSIKSSSGLRTCTNSVLGSWGIHICTYMYRYIYRERERERERQSSLEGPGIYGY